MELNVPDVGLIIAIVAAGFSLFGLTVSKEQKISEFRQIWIDSLREEIARIIAHANAIHGHAYTSNGKFTFEIARDDFVGINEATALVRMRLNPDEELSQSLAKSILRLEEALSPFKSPDFSHLNTIEKEIVARANSVLKAEWKRVKKGELAYRLTRWFSIAVVCVGVAAALISSS